MPFFFTGMIFLFTPYIAHAQTITQQEMEIALKNYLPQVQKIPEPYPYPVVQNLPLAIQQSDVQLIERIIARIEQYHVQLGNIPIPEIAEALWQSGVFALQLKETEVAERLWKASIKIDPYNPYHHLHLAKHLFNKGVPFWKQSFAHLLKAFTSLSRQPGGIFLSVYFIFDNISIFLILFMAMLGIIGIPYYLPLIVHDLSERFNPLEQKKSVAFSIALLIAFFPILFTGLLFTGIWLLLLTLFYQSKLMRSFTIVLFILLLTSIIGGLAFESMYYQYAHMPDRVLYEFYHDSRSPIVMHNLYYRLQENPGDETIILAYAKFFSDNGRYEEAKKVLAYAIQHGLMTPGILNNLGNVFLKMEQRKIALVFYALADAIGPPDNRLKAIIKFNTGAALQALLEFKQAENIIREAEELYPRIIEEVKGQRTIDYLPERKNWTKNEEFPTILIKHIINDRRFLTYVFLLLFFIILQTTKVPSYLAERCQRCGEAFCKHCQTSKMMFQFCNACTHLYIIRDGISPSARERKLEQIQTFQKRNLLLKVLWGMIFPGGAHVVEGHHEKSIFRIFLFSLAIFLFVGISKAGPLWIVTRELPLVAFAGFVILVFVYLLNTISVMIRKV